MGCCKSCCEGKKPVLVMENTVNINFATSRKSQDNGVKFSPTTSTSRASTTNSMMPSADPDDSVVIERKYPSTFSSIYLRPMGLMGVQNTGSTTFMSGTRTSTIVRTVGSSTQTARTSTRTYSTDIYSGGSLVAPKETAWVTYRETTPKTIIENPAFEALYETYTSV